MMIIRVLWIVVWSGFVSICRFSGFVLMGMCVLFRMSVRVVFVRVRSWFVMMVIRVRMTVAIRWSVVNIRLILYFVMMVQCA